MRIVIALFLFGATNSASIFKNPPANAEIEYGYRDNRLTSISIDYSIDRVVQANAVAENVVPDTSSSQSFYKVDDGKLEQVNPTHISYTYGIGLGGHASTAQQAPIPAVQTYAAPPASALAADHMGMNYYKVDDGQLDQVNPTHMSYSAPAPAVASISSPDSFDATYYKVDDGQLEQVNPTHITYYDSAPVTTPVARVRSTSRGRIEHAQSSVPSMQYMATDYLFGATVVPTQKTAPVAQPVHISGPQAVIEEVVASPALKSAEIEPYLLSGPVAEYTIPFGVDIPGIDFTADGLSQPSSVPVKYNPAPEVITYSSAPLAEPMVDNYYKVDDGQLEQVIPTHVSYDSYVPAPIAKTSSRGRVQPISGPVPAVDIYEAPAVSSAVKIAEPEPYILSGPVAEYTIPFGIDIPGIDFTADGFSQPASVPVKSNPTPEVITYSSAPLAEQVVENYYKVDDGQLEQVIPTHVSYDSYLPSPIEQTSSRGRVQQVSAPAPAVDIYAAPVVSFVSDSSPATSHLETYYKVDDGALEQLNPTHVSYSSHVSVPAPAPTPAIQTYAAPALQSVPSPVPVINTYAAPVPAYIPGPAPVVSPFDSFYKVDDGQLEQVNPTHVSYSSHVSIPVHAPAPAVMNYAVPAPAPVPAPAYAPAAPLLDTFYNVDDGQWEQVNPTHVSYSTHVSIPEAVTYSSPEPVVFSPVPEVAVKFDSSPFNAITNMLQTFYTQDDGELEKVTPTHISYSDPMPAIQEPIPAVTLWTPNSVDKKDLTPAVEVTQYNSVATSLPIIKSPSKYTQYMPVEDLLGSTFTSSVKVVNVEVAPAPTPAKIWWTPDPVDKKDLTPTVKAVKVEVAEEKAEVKKSEEEPIVDEEEGGDDVTHVESNSTDEADKGAEDSEGSEGSERAVEAEGSEGDEGAEEDKVTEEDPNTKSEGEEESVDEAETKSEGAEEEEEDSDEKKR